MEKPNQNSKYMVTFLPPVQSLPQGAAEARHRVVPRFSPHHLAKPLTERPSPIPSTPYDHQGKSALVYSCATVNALASWRLTVMKSKTLSLVVSGLTVHLSGQQTNSEVRFGFVTFNASA